MYIRLALVGFVASTFASPFPEDDFSSRSVPIDKRTCDANSPACGGSWTYGSGPNGPKFDLQKLLKNMTFANFLPVRLTPVPGSKDMFGPPASAFDLSKKDWYNKLFPNAPTATSSCPAITNAGVSSNTTNGTAQGVPVPGLPEGTTGPPNNQTISPSDTNALTSAKQAAAAANLTTSTGYTQNCNVAAPQNPIYALNDTTRVAFNTQSGNVAIANATNLDYSAAITTPLNRTDFIAVLDQAQDAVAKGVKPSSNSGILSFTSGTVQAKFIVPSGIDPNNQTAMADNAFAGVVAVWQWLRCDGGANKIMGAVGVRGQVGPGMLLANIMPV